MGRRRRSNVISEERKSEVRRYAYELLPKCSSRRELARKLAKKLGVKPKTAELYLCLAGIKTGFRSSGYPEGLRQYWKEVKEGKRIFGITPSYFKSIAFKILKSVYKEPKFVWELRREFGESAANVCVTLYRRGLLKKFRLGNGTTIYYYPHQKMEAYKKIEKVYPKYFASSVRSILKGLGIKYTYRDSRYKIVER